MLRLQGLSKSYGDKLAVDGLDLEVHSGEIFGLLGPNGAGKTTTLKMISGLVIPDSGSIQVDSVDALKDPERARAMTAYVPDEPSLYSRLSGREFLRFVGRMRDVPPDLLEERIEFHERLFSMEGWLDSRAEGYSHGMTQRVVLSAAFLSRPSLYVIDEPHVGLDPATAETFNRMAEAAADSGAAVILSTHTLPVAHRSCHRMGIIHEGRLVRILSSSEIPRDDLQEIFFSITGTGPADVRSFFDEFDEGRT